jgi:hypothetical protein
MSGRLKRSERFERIVAELRASPAVRISALADEFGVSTETVRRDLDELSRRGLVARTYGGAAVRPMAREPAVNERYRQRVEERSRIGARAAAFVEPGDVLMIDSGSTTSHFARRLAAAAEALTVLTNSINVAAALGQNPKLRVILCPGDYNPREAGVYGPETAAFLRRHHATKAERPDRRGAGRHGFGGLRRETRDDRTRRAPAAPGRPGQVRGPLVPARLSPRRARRRDRRRQARARAGQGAGGGRCRVPPRWRVVSRFEILPKQNPDRPLSRKVLPLHLRLRTIVGRRCDGRR